jgi:capsular polysaccharide biosynthesis protein
MAGIAELLTELIRRWWLTALLVALGACVGLGYAHLSEPVYAAKAYVVVVAQNPGDSTSAVGYAQAYARIAGQGGALDAAASTGAATVKDLSRQVRASTSPDAPVIEITGSAGSAARAADLANLVADALIRTANRRSVETRMTLTLLGEAVPPADPVSPRPVLDIAVGAATGLVLGGLAVLAGGGRGASRATRRDDAPQPPQGTSVDPIAPANGTVVARVPRPIGRTYVSTARAVPVDMVKRDAQPANR